MNRILVSASAGNSGLPGTASNIAPWMLTVAASSIDRRFDVNVVLGNSKVLKGMSLNPAGLKGSHALVPANAAAAPGVTSVNASFCKPNTLNSAVVRGKIVICSIERIGDDRPAKARVVQRAGGIWMILIDPIGIDISFEFVIPSADWSGGGSGAGSICNFCFETGRGYHTDIHCFEPTVCTRDRCIFFCRTPCTHSGYHQRNEWLDMGEASSREQTAC